MNVLYTDPPGDLDLERSTLGDALAAPYAPRERIAVIVVHQTVVDNGLLDCFPALRGVVRLGVGYDKIDLDACQRRGVAVANIPDYCTEEVADTTMAMILTLARGVHELEAALRARPHAWQNLSLDRVRRLSAQTLGVIGAGRIGSAVLERAGAFGMRRIFVDPAVGFRAGAEKVASIPEILQLADIVSVHVPLNESTRGMINGAFIARMKPGSLLVNTARGKLLGNESALLDALESGHLSGAAFDVLPEEPPSREPLFSAWLENAPRFGGRLIVNPHNAFFSRESSVSVRQLGAETALRILEGRPCSRIVQQGRAVAPPTGHEASVSTTLPRINSP